MGGGRQPYPLVSISTDGLRLVARTPRHSRLIEHQEPCLFYVGYTVIGMQCHMVCEKY